jgi:DNA-binding response OmpR family regulator
MEMIRYRLTELSVGDSAAELDAGGNANSGVVEPSTCEPRAEMLSIGGVIFDISRRLVACQNRHARLSQFEFSLLLILARHKDRMISYLRIYRRVWGPTSRFSSSRLRLHVFRLRRRLDKGRMNAIRIVNRGGMGYLMEIDKRAISMGS